MVLAELQIGQIFWLEGLPYELEYLSDSKRVAIAYLLDDKGKRINKPDDLVGDDYEKLIFSDTRFNREQDLL